jgi:hypothetical protein
MALCHWLRSWASTTQGKTGVFAAQAAQAKADSSIEGPRSKAGSVRSRELIQRQTTNGHYSLSWL